jgi:hypothetical protein
VPKRSATAWEMRETLSAQGSVPHALWRRAVL